MSFNRISRRLLSYLFRGILLSVPLALTVYVLYSAFVAVDHVVPGEILGREIPGLGILTLLGTFIVLGWLGGTILAQPFIIYFKRLLDQVPLIKTLYNSIKDFLSAFVGQKKSFNVPVLVKLSENSEVEQLGFVTAEDLSALKIKGDKVAVYIPMSFSVAGHVYIVPKNFVKKVDARAPEVMKFIVSGGVTTVEQNEEKHDEQ